MEEQLMGVSPELDNNRPGGVNSIVERPAPDGLPEVIGIVNDDEGNLPIYGSSDKEEVGEVEIAVDEGEVRLDFVGERHVFNRVIAHVMALSDIEEEEEEEEDEDAWSDPSEDSGYESKSEHEEDSEDDDINVIIRPPSPLNQLFPAPSFWQGLHRGSSPVGRPAGAPFCCPFGVLPAQQEERPEEGQPSVCQRSEESAPSTSGLSSSTKRNREEDCTEQLGVKRQSQCEDSHEEPASSTSGLSSSAKRSREEDCTEQVGVKRQRQYEDSHEEPASSTSGLGSSTNRSREEDYYRYGFRRYWQFSPDNSDSDSD